MAGSWVYKADGTIQCEQSTETTLDAMRVELAKLIDGKNILNQEKRSIPAIALCGSPTGKVNAYEITEEGLYVLFHGIVGPCGFRVWGWDGSSETRRAQATDALADDLVPWPFRVIQAEDQEQALRAFREVVASLTAVGTQPTMIAELIGRQCRCYKHGDMLTTDYLPQRVNIELNAASRIERIWFG